MVAEYVIGETLWRWSDRADPDVVPIADRHYSRQKIGAPQFVKPGRCLVLKSGTRAQLRMRYGGGAYWVTSWPFAAFVKHQWAGAWECSAFRNEGAGLSSCLIRDAIAITCGEWEPPHLGMVTFVDESQTMRGRGANSKPGKCFLDAGFEEVGHTKGGLIALQMKPAQMPDPIITRQLAVM